MKVELAQVIEANGPSPRTPAERGKMPEKVDYDPEQPIELLCGGEGR